MDRRNWIFLDDSEAAIRRERLVPSSDEMKIIVGLAMLHAYYSSPKSVGYLSPSWDNPDARIIEQQVKHLSSSSGIEERELGLMLQQALAEGVVEPDAVAWRDLALDIGSSEVNLVDYMWRVSELEKHEIDAVKKKILGDAWTALQRWQGDLGMATSSMRESKWTDAKIHIEKAHDISLSPSLDSLMRSIWQLEGAIRSHREHTQEFRERISTYPSKKIAIPKDRVGIILRVEEQLLKLHKIGVDNESDHAVQDAVSYPTEKLGTAVRYLISPDIQVEAANYEIGIASGHIRPRAKGIGGTVGRQLTQVVDALDIIFSELPAKPWPVLGFGRLKLSPGSLTTIPQRLRHRHYLDCCIPSAENETQGKKGPLV